MPDMAAPRLPALGAHLGECAPGDWAALVQAVNPASLVVVIESRMSGPLRSRTTAEDLWQETLLSAWKDRSRCVWQDLPTFRRWLLQVANNRIHDAADRENAGKRALSAEAPPPERDPDTGSAPFPWEPAGSTTPSRVAMLREQAQAMREALNGLDAELRDVVRLRLFEGLSNAEVAETLGLGLSAVKHRYRRGSAAYAELLRDVLKSRSQFTPRA